MFQGIMVSSFKLELQLYIHSVASIHQFIDLSAHFYAHRGPISGMTLSF